MKRRILSIITALALCLSLCPTWALAAEADPSLCKHHPEHTEDCGYTAPTEGHDCGHEHTEDCFTTDEAGGEVLDCHHSHDSACGYVQADPGTPCGYVCRICPIEDLIAALPEQVTEDNADDVRAQLDHILDLYRELDEGEQEEINLSRIYALQGALDAANDPDMIEGEVSVTYQEASWNGSEVTYTGKTENCTSVEGSTEAVTWNAGWYVVNSTVTISEPITVTGAVNLILADGCTLDAQKGIVVTTDNSLTIYAQSGGTGTLNATGTTDSSNNASAGIGGSTASVDSGTITIHGGVINAIGGVSSFKNGAAGIGGGTVGNGNGGNSGTIIIYGGTVTANSGEGNVTGAGIGGGASGNNSNGGAGSNITIYGGSVTAASTGIQSGGAGIGGGGGFTGGGAGSNIQIYGGTINATGSEGGAGIGGGGSSGTSGDGTVTISGGIVTAVGGTNAAGIGGGGGYSTQYSSCTGGAGSVTITGGIVDATGGAGNSSGDYAGAPIGNGGNTTATATVNKTTGIVFENSAGTVCGAVTLDGSYTVPGDYTLNIPVGASLSGSGTLSGGSAFTTENLTEDMISVPEDWHYTGEDRTADIETKLSGELDKGVTICGQTFMVSGWTLAVEKAADSDLTYTAIYTNNSDNTKTVQKTITLLQSGTDLTDGKVKTYKDGAECSDFTAGDTITVKAMPTATGKAPDNSAMFAASFTAPTAGQMAVFVGDTQVSAPVGAVDGSYTMTVSAADVLLAAGGPGTEITLTARFTANDNMADGAGTVTVNITAVAKAERGGTVLGYYDESNLDKAFANDGATVTLLADVKRTNTLTIKVNCTLDLGGHNITFTGTENAWVQGSVTTMTIRGEGEIVSEQSHALVVSGSVTLEGGTFTSRAGGCAGVRISSADAQLIVTNEHVVMRNTSSGGYGLAVNSAQSVQLSAGTYSSIAVASPHTLASLLVAGYAYYKDGSPIPLSELADQKELTGPVTVQECQHTAAEYTPNENDASTHTKTCLACSYTETGDCGFEKTADPTADSHTGQCPDCKRDRSGAHSFSDWAGNPVARTCTVCGYEQTAVAKVEKDSTTTYVGALANAFTEGNSGATVTLLSEVDLGSNYIGIRGSSTFTLDLNGQTVRASHYGAFDISGGSLTIQDSGTGGKIESSNITIKVTGGTLSIKSGTVSGFYGVQITSGTVNISGGVISGTENGLWVNGGGNIVLSGGAYSGIHAILVDANVSVTLKDLLATGYAYHQNDIPIANATGWLDSGNSGDVPLDTNPAWLTGTVTVKECNHTGGLVPSENGYQHGGPCKCCGTELTAANHTLGADNKCGGCGAELAAKVEKSGSDTVYVEASGLADVFAENSGNDGATITLLDNITTSKQINVGADNLTLDLNGKTYTCTQNDFHLSFVSLTIKGSGAITTSGYYCLTMDGGTLNIESGSFSAKDSAVYVENDGRLQLTGGSFAGEKSAIEYASGDVKAALANYGGADAPHYAFYQGSSPYTPSGHSLPSGTFTVRTCEHDGVPVQDLGGGKHGLTCPYCGYHSKHTTTLTATASGNTVTFRGGCASCDYQEEALAAAAFTFPKLTYGQTGQTVSCTWEHPNGYALMVQIDSGEELQIDVSDTQVSLPLKQLFGSQEINAGNYQLHVYCRSYADVTSNVCSLPVTVEKAPLTPSITGTATKTYDGTTNCDGTGLSIALDGVVTGDDVTATATSYAYDNANAGENKTITVSGITLEGDSKDNYTLSITTATTTGTITKSQPTIAFVSGYNPSKDYDGQTIPNPVADNLTITGATFRDVTFAWSNPPKDAGTYTLTATIAETNNTEAASATLTVTISPKAVTPTITITPSSYEYTGSAIHPSGSAVKVMDGDTVIPDSEYTLSYGENTQVGTGSVTVTDKENGNYEIAQTTETFTITAKPLTGAKVEVTGTFTYTGNALTPAPTVTLDGKTLTENTDYTVAYDKNTDAGTATITVTGKGNYSGTAQGTFTIGRATLTADGTGTASGIYGDKLSELTVSGLTAKLGEATVTGTWKLAGGTVPNVGDSGEYTATFTPATGADNYNALEAKVTLNIAKANYTGTTTASTSAKFGTTGTYDLSALLPDGATVETAATTSNIFEGTPSVSDKTLTYKLKAGATVGSTGPITVPVTSANYNNFNLTITVTVTAKDVPTLTVSPITVTYTGEAVPGTAIKGTAKVGSTTVPGTWAFASGEAVTNVADSGTKTVKFVPTDGTNYAEATATVVVTINKATPTGAPKYTAISTSGKTLADAGLTTEGSTLKPAGTVAWVLGTDTAVTANTQYEWTFTPTDTANYNTLTGKITLWPYTAPVNPGGGYVPSNPGGSTLPVTTTGQGSTTTTTTTTATPTASTQGGTATTTINTAMGNEIVKQAVANKSEEVVIAPNVTGSVTKAEVSIPASTVGQIGSQTNASLTVSTPVADVTIPNGGLGSLGSAGGTVTVTAEQVGNSVELTVTAGGRTVQNVPGGVTLTVPAASTTPGTVAVLVHPDGTREVVRKSVTDNGAVTIPLDGSAKLEIVDNSKYFADVPATSWATDAVAFASAHELFGGTGANQFSPDLPMSRGMLAVVLHNLESNPAQALTGAFADVDNSQWYAEGVAWAEAQGIIGGYGNGRFGPNDNITREQLAVMLWRYAGSPAATDRELHFADAHRASDWALDALRWATEKGIINGKGSGILDPTGQATRAETAQMLKNFMESK